MKTAIRLVNESIKKRAKNYNCDARTYQSFAEFLADPAGLRGKASGMNAYDLKSFTCRGINFPESFMNEYTQNINKIVEQNLFCDIIFRNAGEDFYRKLQIMTNFWMVDGIIHPNAYYNFWLAHAKDDKNILDKPTLQYQKNLYGPAMRGYLGELDSASKRFVLAYPGFSDTEFAVKGFVLMQGYVIGYIAQNQSWENPREKIEKTYAIIGLDGEITYELAEIPTSTVCNISWFREITAGTKKFPPKKIEVFTEQRWQEAFGKGSYYDGRERIDSGRPVKVHVPYAAVEDVGARCMIATRCTIVR
ncbi:MAG: hypothetical protein FWE64_03790 [Alphaproteobacteria bacterium]|nr:hypothetical protein [Alphaproteobacteria bacterium]